VKTFDRDEVLAFLAEIDEMLAEPAAMEIIGGAAALLAYGAHSATKDIDSLANIDERIQQAARRTTRTIPLDRAAIADPPYNYDLTATTSAAVSWPGLNARARGAVVEATGPRSTAPGVISRGFEVDDPQYQREGKERTRAGDGAEDTGLGCAFWKPLTGEAETGCAEQGQQEPNNGGEDSRSPIKPCNGVEQLLRILVQWLDGDDRTKSAPLPGRNGGARDRNVPGEAPHPGAWHLLPESMIVGAARVWRGRDGRDHRGSMPRRSSAGAESSAMLAPELAGI
jgi:hypothetical protein